MSYLVSDIIAFGCIMLAIGVPLYLFGCCLYELAMAGWEIDNEDDL